MARTRASVLFWLCLSHPTAWGSFASSVASRTSCPGLCRAPAGYRVTASGSNLEPCPHNHYQAGSPSTCTRCPRPSTIIMGRDVPRDVPHIHNRMAGRQMSCRQQTAPPLSRCSKDVTDHPHRPGARPGSPCPVPACSGQPPPGQRRFSSPLRNRILQSNHEL